MGDEITNETNMANELQKEKIKQNKKLMIIDYFVKNWSIQEPSIDRVPLAL